MYLHPGKKLMFMGSEFGQGREWDHDQSLDWHLLDEPLHAGLKQFVQDLNRVYRTEPALYQCDFESSGFHWIDANDSDNSVVSFTRRATNSQDFLVAVLNFTPVPREGYQLGVPRAGPVHGAAEQRRRDLRRWQRWKRRRGVERGCRGPRPAEFRPADAAASRVCTAKTCLSGKMQNVKCKMQKSSCIHYFALDISRICFHCSSVTGITDRRGSRVSGNEAKRLSALIAESVTGAASLRPAPRRPPTACPSCPPDPRTRSRPPA